MVRFKNRYVLVEVEFPTHVDGTTLSTALGTPLGVAAPMQLTPALLTQVLKNEIETNFGSCGAGRFAANVAIKYHSPHTALCIVRCPRDGLRPILACIALISQLRRGVPCVWRVRHVGGTVKKVQTAAIHRSTVLLHQLAATGVIPQKEVDRLLADCRTVLSRLEL